MTLAVVTPDQAQARSLEDTSIALVQRGVPAIALATPVENTQAEIKG